MYTKLNAVFATCLLAALTLAGCRPKTQAVRTGENGIVFDSIEVVDTCFFDGDNPHVLNTFEAKFIFPSEYGDPAVLQRLTIFFIATFFGDEEDVDYTDPRAAMTGYAGQYRERCAERNRELLEEEDEDSRYCADCYQNLYNEILYNRNSLLSFAVNVDMNTGGAHGMFARVAYTFDFTTGERLDESDLFVDGYEEALSALIVEALMKASNVSDPSELEAAGYFSVDEIYPNGNFYLDGEGITYIYNEYEIAPYFVGKTEVRLPYKSVETLLKLKIES